MRVLLWFYAISMATAALDLTKRVVLTNRGICDRRGCSLAVKHLYFKEDRILVGPKELGTGIRTDQKYNTLYYEFFRHSHGYVFHYCNTELNFYMRCSEKGFTHPIMIHYFEKHKFNGIYVKNRLPCLTPCSLQPLKLGIYYLGCKFAAWDDFKASVAECSLHLDFENFAQTFYRLSLYGLIVAFPDDNKRMCITLTNSPRGWRTVECSDNVGPVDLAGRYCESPCRAEKGRLVCTLQDGQRTPCTINLKTADAEYQNCKNWLETSILNQRQKIQMLPDSSPVVHDSKLTCDGENLIVKGKILYLSRIKKLSRGFSCPTSAGRELAKSVTMLATEIMYIDADFRNLGNQETTLKQFTLLSKQIVVTKKSRIELKGFDAVEGVGDWANGGDGANVVIFGLTWNNPGLLTIDVSGGGSGCKLVPLYTEIGPTSFHSIYTRQIEFNHSNYEFRYIIPTSDANCIGCHEFMVRNILEYKKAQPGKPGMSKIYVATMGHPTLVHELGVQDECYHEVEDSANCANILYMENATWHAAPFEKPLQVTGADESTFYHVRRWICELSDVWNDSDISILSEFVDSAQTVLGLNSPTMFYEELKYLILNSSKINDRLEIQLLDSLKLRIANHTGAQNNDLLRWDYAAVLAHRRRISGYEEVIYDIVKYIDAVYDSVSTLDNHDGRIRLINNAEETFTNASKKKITDAHQLIKNEVLKEIEQIQDHMTAKFENVLEEIKVILANHQDRKDKLQENLKKAVFARNLNVIFDYYKMAGSVVAAIPPVSWLGAAVAGGATFAKTLNNHINQRATIKPSPPNPKRIGADLKSTSDWVSQKRKKLIASLQKLLNLINGQPHLKVFAASLETDVIQLEALNPIQNPSVSKRQEYYRTMEIKRSIDQRIKEVQYPSSVMLTSRKGSRVQRESKFEFSKAVTDSFSGFNDGVKDFITGTAEIANIEKEIVQAENDIQEWKQFADEVRDDVMPMILGILDSFDLVSNELNVSSLSEIDLNAWRIENNLNDIIAKLESGIGGFGAGSDIIAAMKKVKTAMLLVAKIFGNVVGAKDEIRFATLNAQLSAAIIEKGELESFKKNLDNAMVEAIIFGEVEKAKNGLRRWSFPFASVYLHDFEPSPFTFQSNNSVDKTVHNSRVTLMKIKEILRHSESVVNIAHENTLEKNFTPFFTWEYKNHNSSILQLLEGNEVYFYADVNLYMDSDTNSNAEAVKFKTARFNFEVVNNLKAHKRIQKEIKHCILTATHLGFSYYKFQNKTYLFSGRKTKFTYNGESQSIAANLLSKNTAVLSPYGLWVFKIEPLSKKYVLDGLRLKERDIVNLALTGQGTYVQNYEDPAVDIQYKHYEVEEGKEPDSYPNRSYFVSS